MNSANYRLCQVLSVLPATSVDCERGFSQLNRIKTDLRNKLGNDHLESAFRIATTSISVTELRSHSKELIQCWRNSKSRRSGDKGDTLISAQEMSGGGMTQHSISQEPVLPTIRMEGLLGKIRSDRYSLNSQNIPKMDI